MLKWIFIGIFVISLAFSSGLMIATAYGTSQNQTVLTITISQRGFDGPQQYQLYDVENRLLIPLNFPVENLLFAQNWWDNPQEFVLITQSDVTNPNEGDLTRRTRQYGVYNFDLSSGKKIPLLEYSRGGRSSLTLLRLYNDLQPFFSLSGQTAGFYDSALNKLFVYDRKDDFNHLHTATVDLNNGTNRLAWSPDGLKVAAQYSPGLLIVMDVDQDEIDLYDIPERTDFTPEWSSDGRYILISDPNEANIRPLGILDVETRQWVNERAAIVGRSAHWLCKSEWISYETYKTQPVEEFAHILHVPSGRSYHLSDHPLLMEHEFNRISTPDCEHLILIAGADSLSSGRPTPVFISDMTLHDVRLLHPDVFRNSVEVTDGRISYTVQDSENQIAIYHEPLDGSSAPELLRTIPSSSPGYFGYFDDFHKGLYLNYNSQTQHGLYLVDFESGSSRLISNPGDRISDADLFYQD